MAARSRRNTIAALSLPLFVLATAVCRADDCGPTAHAYEDRVVLFTCGKTGAPEFDVILLDDAAALKVAGRIPVEIARSFDAAGNYKKQWIVVTWDRLEIYNLADPAHPALAAKFLLKKQPPAPGYGRIEQIAENKFVVLSTVGAAELTAESDGVKWTLTDISRTSDHLRKMTERPPEARFSLENHTAVVARDTRQFRYELIWKGRAKPGQFVNRQYLRKVDKARQRTVSSLALGARLETID
jgi:hypothetical protein